MTRKSIQTNGPVVSCDVCGRTLLRGEHADVFLHSGSRRMVCQLCTARAAHEGWIREGLDDATVRSRGEGHRGSFLSRLRARRADHRPAPDPGDDLAGFEDADPYAAPAEDAAAWQPQPEPEPEPVAVAVEPPPPAPVPAPVREREPVGAREPLTVPPRDQRSVHAVPTNAGLKMARALELFNASPHRRTVAGVGRSLGAPLVTVRPSATEGSVVTVAVAWELSWYRFEVDLADEAAGPRVAGQGSELDELDPEDRTPNAAADETGALHLAGAPA